MVDYRLHLTTWKNVIDYNWLRLPHVCSPGRVEDIINLSTIKYLKLDHAVVLIDCWMSTFFSKDIVKQWIYLDPVLDFHQGNPFWNKYSLHKKWENNICHRSWHIRFYNHIYRSNQCWLFQLYKVSVPQRHIWIFQRDNQ